MNANAIQEKILSDARTSASDIMRDANEKAARLRDAAEKRMAAAHSRLMMQASEDAEAARLRMERMEELEERKRLLSDKRALIDEAFAQALDKLEAMPPEIALTPKGGFLLPKTLATRVEGVVPYVPPDTPLVIVPDRRKSKSAGNGLAERRVAELIRRLAQPAGHHSKPPPSDPTDPA